MLQIMIRKTKLSNRKGPVSIQSIIELVRTLVIDKFNVVSLLEWISAVDLKRV